MFLLLICFVNNEIVIIFVKSKLTSTEMGIKEFKLQLHSKRMETKAKLDVLRAMGVKKFERQIDALLKRMNDIDEILKELEKES